MPGLNLKAAQWEQQHKTHVEEYLRQIEALYDVASDENQKRFDELSTNFQK